MDTEKTALATIQPQSNELAFDPWTNSTNFELTQRMATMLSRSQFVPDTYKNNIADCFIALDISRRTGMNVMAVMQSLYTVHGKPAWSGQMMIALANTRKGCSSLKFQMTGTPGQDNWGCIAYSVRPDGSRESGPEVTLGMAKAEGWYGKNGSKWKTMPELMLHYRAATFYVRLHAPELAMGIKTADEIIDIQAERITPQAVKEMTIPVTMESAKEADEIPMNFNLK